MGVIYCLACDVYIDLDVNCEHFKIHDEECNNYINLSLERGTMGQEEANRLRKQIDLMDYAETYNLMERGDHNISIELKGE